MDRKKSSSKSRAKKQEEKEDEKIQNESKKIKKQPKDTKPKVPKKNNKSTKGKSNDDSPSESSEGLSDVSSPIEEKKSSAKSRAKKHEEKEDEKIQKESKKIKKQPKDTKPKVSKKKKGKSDDDSDSEEKGDLPIGRRVWPGTKNAETANQGSKGITVQQKKQIEELTETLKSYKASELKEMLEKNGQRTYGSKTELTSRIADGKVLGRIPNCPHCKQGIPKLDYDTGIYLCKGYNDSALHHHNCFTEYTMKELPREKWIE